MQLGLEQIPSTHLIPLKPQTHSISNDTYHPVFERMIHILVILINDIIELLYVFLFKCWSINCLEQISILAFLREGLSKFTYESDRFAQN